MDLNQLRYVIELAKQKNFSHAAETLYITQPALSQQVSRLEQELGFQIFVRSTKRVSLTPIGEEFILRAQAVLESFTDLQQFSSLAARVINNVILFGSSTNSSTYVSFCIPIFMSEFPNTTFKYEETWDINLIHLLENKSLDLALILMSEEQLNNKKLNIQLLYSDYICALVAKDDALAKRGCVSLNELLARKLIFSSPSSTLRHVIMEHAPDKESVESNSLYIARREAQFPLIENHAVGFALYQQKRASLSAQVACVPIEPRISLSHVLATHEGITLDSRMEKILQIAADKMSEALLKNTRGPSFMT